MEWLDDIIGAFGGGGGGGAGGGSGLGPFLAALGSAGLNAFSSMSNNDAQIQASQENQQFTAGEAEKERQLRLQMLMMQLAKGSGGGGGGGAAASANVRRQAIADAMQSKLQGAQNNQGALKLFLDGIQAPYMRTLGG